MKKAIFFVVPALLVLAGIASLIGVTTANRAASRNDHWTQAVATIEKAEVHPGRVDVAYRYQAGGAEHRNPRGTLRDGAAREAQLARYVAGRQVLIYVNPANAAESVLQLPPRPPSWPLVAGTVLLVLGLSLAVVFARYQKSHPHGRKAVRKAARPMSRLRPPPPIKRP